MKTALVTGANRGIGLGLRAAILTLCLLLGPGAAPSLPAATQIRRTSLAPDPRAGGPPEVLVTPQPDVLVTRQLAEARGLSVGDVISLSARPDGAGARPFRVAGVYEPVPDPLRLTSQRLEVRLHLPDLLAMTADPNDPEKAEAVRTINLSLKDHAGAPDLARDLVSRMPVLVARPTASDEAGPFEALERFHAAIAIVTVIGSTAFLLALMVMRADERRETAGILRLIGLTRRRVLVEVLVEGLVVAVAGAVFGVLFAAATQGIVNLFFQARYDTALVFVRVTPAIAARCVALAVPLGVFAGFVASWNLLRRDIVELLRR